jgi:RIO-like serine/threonine protein kinase
MAAALGAAATIEEKRAILAAVARLVATLTTAGARHPDLNIKNILIAPDENGSPQALVLDVDRIWFDAPGAHRVTMRNLQRLIRSARKWRRLHALPLTEQDLRCLSAAVDDPSRLDGP